MFNLCFGREQQEGFPFDSEQFEARIVYAGAAQQCSRSVGARTHRTAIGEDCRLVA